MNKLQTFQEFLATQSVQVPVVGFIISLLLTLLLSFVLSLVYIRFGTSLSNRRAFSKNFILLAMTTMLIITIVKSSLALSLGLVGALSIVRFRAAIKEPEELTYLFLNIALGLGFGANQIVITLTAFIIIVVVVIFKNLSHKGEKNSNLLITVSSRCPKAVTLELIVNTLAKHCPSISMRRFNENNEILEGMFLVEFDTFEQLRMCKEELQQHDSSIEISYIDSKGVS